MRRIFLAAFLLLAPVAAFAAIIPDTGSTLQLGMTPQYPQPGDSVAFTVVDYTPGADGANYTWTVNGTVALKGIGAKNFTLTAGNLGETQTVSVVADQGGIPTGSASEIIRPASVDIVWEGKTVRPPLYIGRPLPNGGSQVTLLAVPHVFVSGKEIPASSLIYTWKEDDVPLGGKSGYGKSSITVTPPRFGQSFTVSVHAETVDGRGAGDGSAVITPQTPRLLVYENAPLLGLRFEKAVAGTFALSEPEVSFTAFPLFVADADALSYQWTLDGSPFAVDPEKPRDATLRKVGSGTGDHAVSFSFTNPKNFMEEASASFTLHF